MRDCIVIRTHKWDQDETRLLQMLRPVFGEDIFAAFHAASGNPAPPIPHAAFDDDWVSANGLRVLEDYGWRCGDYALYAARAAFPDYDRYWLIEPDVYIFGDVRAFFAQAAELEGDAVGVDLTAMDRSANRFTKGLPKVALYRATYALTRFSAPAIDDLFAKRKAYSASNVGDWRFTNDEVFSFSHVIAQERFTAASLQDAMPQWFEREFFTTNPDLLDRALEAELSGVDQVCHPVRPAASYCTAVGERVTQSASGFLKKMSFSLAQMTSEERQMIVQATTDSLEALLESLSAPGQENPNTEK